jgi:hypothetical protein
MSRIKQGDVFQLVADSDKFCSLVFSTNTDWDLLQSFDGTSSSKRITTPLRVEIFGEDSMIKGDYPSLIPHVPVFSDKAWSRIKSSIPSSITTYLLVDRNNEYFIALDVPAIDILDVDRSQVERFRSTGRTLNISQYSFKVDAFPLMFKLPETALSKVYVNRNFVSIVTKLGLTGMLFKELKIA